VRGLVSGVVLAALLSGCSDVPLPPIAEECHPGETRCDGVQIETCVRDEEGGLTWGPPSDCPGGGQCQNGRCVDDCGVCDVPPNTCYETPGTCWQGTCNYTQKASGAACDDGDACTDGDVCAAGACKGSPVLCATPPANTCKDASTLVVHAPIGVCSLGACSYPTSEVACPLGCDSGVCAGDPCASKTCDQPPNPCYASSGICSGGQCFYNYDDGKTCDDQDACTVSDQCVGGTCVGTSKVCDTPPASACKDASSLLVYDKQGTCTGGTCTYTQKTVSCSHGCDTAAAECKSDPCDSVVCANPPSSCYKTPGTCTAGTCDYAFDDGKTCSDGDACTTGDVCNAGSCKGSVITCNSPPASVCKDANTLTVYSAPGTCSGGSCTYGSADLPCTFGCDAVNKVCKGDPCSTVTCTSPPNTQCYSVPGICSAGTCTYLPTSGTSCNDNDPCTKTDVCGSSGTCAGVAYTCNDNLTCTTDTCNGSGGCTYPLKSGYCKIKNTCYADGATNPSNACQHCDVSKSTSQWTAPSGTALQTWSFDAGTLQGFTVTPNPATSPCKWQVDNQRSVSGSYSLYFGDVSTRDYDDPGETVAGEVTSPAVSLPTGQGKLCLRFQLYNDTEGYDWDILSVRIIPASGSATTVWDATMEPNWGLSTAFVAIGVDISASAGKSVQIQFAFDTEDDIANDYEGVYLDDIQVLTNCSP